MIFLVEELRNSLSIKQIYLQSTLPIMAEKQEKNDLLTLIFFWSKYCNHYFTMQKLSYTFT